MATKNPRVVSYVSPNNYAKLKEFVEQQGLTESKAIDAILSQFFVTASDATSSTAKEVVERVAALEQQMAVVVGEFVA